MKYVFCTVYLRLGLHKLESGKDEVFVMNVKINQQMPFGNMQVKGVQSFQKSSMRKDSSSKNDIAAIMKVSREASSKARLEQESRQNRQQALRTITDIVDTVQAGGKLSREEQEIFDRELQSMGKSYYDDMKNYRIDTSDPSQLTFLREHYMQRIDMYLDLQKEVKEKSIEEELQNDNVLFAMSKVEQEEKEELIEALEKSLEEEDEEADSEETKEHAASKEDSGVEDLEKPFAEADMTVEKEALGAIEGNKEALSDMEKQSQNEGAKKLEFDQMLDQEYEKLQKILESDELSNEEKLRSYEKYRENAYDFAFNREVERTKQKFDFETWLVNKIQFLAHDELGEVTGNGTKLKNQIGREFIDAFLK